MPNYTSMEISIRQNWYRNVSIDIIYYWQTFIILVWEQGTRVYQKLNMCHISPLGIMAFEMPKTVFV
jgi:hypothetical protein